MLVKPFAHGKGSGDAAVYYLLRMDYHGRQEHPPNILRGDPDMTKELINSIDRKWKFTAGVCSWSGEDTVTPEQEVEVMNRFEELAFAGLEHDQYDILWVRHSHANHHELHFVTPRMELLTGKAFNAFPPGWEKDFGHFRNYMNVKHDWTRPDDPDRKRMFTPSNADIIEARLTRWGQNPTKNEKDNARKEINNFIQGRIENGLIHDRADIISTLQEVGLQINREGKNYISVKDPDSDIKIRFKGKVYEHQWTAANSTGEAAKESRAGTGRNPEDVQGELAKHEQGLTKVIRKRAIYNENRYPSTNPQDIKKVEKGIPFNEQSIPRDMVNKRNDGIDDIYRSDSGTLLLDELANRQNNGRNRKTERFKKSSSKVHDRPRKANEQDRESISSQRQKRDFCGFSERNRSQHVLRDTRQASNTSQIVNTENSNINQGEQNENTYRGRIDCTRDDRINKVGNAEKYRRMETRASKGVRAYNSQVGMLRRICKALELITQRLREVTKSHQRNRQRSINRDHDFER